MIRKRIIFLPAIFLSFYLCGSADKLFHHLAISNSFS